MESRMQPAHLPLQTRTEWLPAPRHLPDFTQVRYTGRTLLSRESVKPGSWASSTLREARVLLRMWPRAAQNYVCVCSSLHRPSRAEWRRGLGGGWLAFRERENPSPSRLTCPTPPEPVSETEGPLSQAFLCSPDYWSRAKRAGSWRKWRFSGFVRTAGQQGFEGGRARQGRADWRWPEGSARFLPLGVPEGHTGWWPPPWKTGPLGPGAHQAWPALVLVGVRCCWDLGDGGGAPLGVEVGSTLLQEEEKS